MDDADKISSVPKTKNDFQGVTLHCYISVIIHRLLYILYTVETPLTANLSITAMHLCKTARHFRYTLLLLKYLGQLILRPIHINLL